MTNRLAKVPEMIQRASNRKGIPSFFSPEKMDLLWKKTLDSLESAGMDSAAVALNAANTLDYWSKRRLDQAIKSGYLADFSTLTEEG